MKADNSLLAIFERNAKADKEGGFVGSNVIRAAFCNVRRHYGYGGFCAFVFFRRCVILTDDCVLNFSSIVYLMKRVKTTFGLPFPF